MTWANSRIHWPTIVVVVGLTLTSEFISASNCFCWARTVHWNSHLANTCHHR